MATSNPAGRKTRDAVFQPEFIEDLRHWVETDRKVALRDLIWLKQFFAIRSQGSAKPEPIMYLHPACGRDG